MKTLFIIFLCLIGLPSFSQRWVQKASIPSYTGVQTPVSFAINGKLYVGAGLNASKSFNTFYEYDPASNAWTQKANLPDSIYSACSFALNGKGYVTCGANPGLTTKVYAYDPSADTWQTKNNFPGSGRQNLNGCSLNGKGYLCGGFIGGSSCGSDMWQYNDTTDHWTQMADMPGPGRNGTFPIVINDRIYVGLGSNSDGSTWYSDFYSFNPDSNTYSRMTDLPSPAGGCIFFAIGQTGYIGLGSNGTAYTNTIYKYNATNNSWSQGDTFAGGTRFVAFSQVVNGKPYIGCGTDRLGSYYYDNWTWDNATSVAEVGPSSPFLIYPNPSADFITISTKAELVGTIYSLIDMTGRIILSGKINEPQSKISIIDLTIGVYQLQVAGGSYKIIKK